jgi:hypothetical protein
VVGAAGIDVLELKTVAVAYAELTADLVVMMRHDVRSGER